MGRAGRIGAGALLCAAALLAPARAGDCPDQRATHVDGHVAESSSYSLCESRLELFGLGLTLRVDCPKWLRVYPDHQECLGEFAPGRDCLPQGLLDVQLLLCECRGVITPDGTLGHPACDCQYQGSIGVVETFRTAPCEGS